VIPRLGEKHFTASAIILDEDHRVLMHFHHKLQCWLYPGGHVEPNEEPQEALQREVKEEVGIETRIIDCARHSAIALVNDQQDVVELPSPLTILCERIGDKNGDYHWHIDLIYLCRSPAACVAAHSGFKWFTMAEVEKLACPRELPSLIGRAIDLCRHVTPR